MRALCLLFAMALVGVPSVAQDIPDPPPGEDEMLRIESASTEAPPEQFVVNRRPPIPFEPFSRIDPTSGKPIAPETLLTLPDGRVVNAAAYYDELDRFESDLNQLGYSLRDPGTEVVLEEAYVDEEEFRRAESRLRHMQRQIGRVEAEQMERLRRSESSIPSSLTEESAGGPPWSEEWSAGDEDVFAVSLGSKLDLKRTYTSPGVLSGAELTGETAMGGSAFGETFSILSVSAQVKAPNVGTKSVTWRVASLGKVFFDKTVQGDLRILLPTEKEREEARRRNKPVAIEKSFNKHTSYHFSLGGIPLTAEAGVLGKAKLIYEMSAISLSATASLQPSVVADVYFQVGVDFLVGGGGAGADMTLLDASVDLYGTGELNLYSGILSATATCDYELEALHGSVYAYVYVYVPKKWPPFYKKVVYRKEFWPGGVRNGIRDRGQLFNFRGLLRK